MSQAQLQRPLHRRDRRVWRALPDRGRRLGTACDHECRHGRLPFDRSPVCGCWPQEGGAVVTLPRQRASATSSRRAA